ncbi:MAG: redoxin domain-containing protein [Bdellovibrionota bacterium]
MAHVGDRAPDFRLKNERGEPVSLGEIVRTRPAMLVFYPGDFTMVCTKQLCAYQDSMNQFSGYGIEILGISPNDSESHAKFKDRYQFAFHLLSDPGRLVAREYQITSLLLLGGISRAVFIVSKGGKVLYRYVEPTTITHRRPQELVEILDRLRQAGQI